MQPLMATVGFWGSESTLHDVAMIQSAHSAYGTDFSRLPPLNMNTKHSAHTKAHAFHTDENHLIIETKTLRIIAAEADIKQTCLPTVCYTTHCLTRYIPPVERTPLFLSIVKPPTARDIISTGSHNQHNESTNGLFRREHRRLGFRIIERHKIQC